MTTNIAEACKQESVFQDPDVLIAILSAVIFLLAVALTFKKG